MPHDEMMRMELGMGGFCRNLVGNKVVGKTEQSLPIPSIDDLPAFIRIFEPLRLGARAGIIIGSL